jgi:predicted RNase H-like HicB family nuclease
LIGWQELRNVDSTIKTYSKVVMELTSLYDHWLNLEPEERTTSEFYKMVRVCEEVLWTQNKEWVRSMQEVLQETGLDREAELINRVIKESVESAERAKEGITEAVVEQTRESLEEQEKKVEETIKAALGSLAEEASSELVQQELDAMSKAVVEMAEQSLERASFIKSSLADIVKDLVNVDIGRDTSKEELNAVLARLPKTADVKG